VSTPVLDAVVIANMVAKNIGMGLGAEGFNLSVDSECVAPPGAGFYALCARLPADRYVVCAS
jgi:hypothetical protein